MANFRPMYKTVLKLNIPEKPLIGDTRIIMFHGVAIHQMWTGKKWWYDSCIMINDKPIDDSSLGSVEGKIVRYNNEYLDNKEWK